MVRNHDGEIVVMLQPALLQEAQRIATQENWTVSDAVVFLAKCGAEQQRKAEEALHASYSQFMAGPENPQASDDLIRSIFGPDSIGQNQLH